MKLEYFCVTPSLPCSPTPPLPHSLSQYPTVRLIKLDDDMLKYKPEATEITAENLRAFLTEFFDGKLSVSFQVLHPTKQCCYFLHHVSSASASARAEEGGC